LPVYYEAYRELTVTDTIDKKSLSERDICTKFITPAIKDVAGWDEKMSAWTWTPSI
jgi:type I site-specific restriction endonuclease